MRSLSSVRVLAMAITIAALSSIGCSKVLGLQRGVPGGECALSLDCPPDEACVLSVCSPTCLADNDCPTSSQCWMTPRDGNRCVDRAKLMSLEPSAPGGDASLGDADESSARDAGSVKDASSGDPDGIAAGDAGTGLADGSLVEDSSLRDDASGSDADAAGSPAPGDHCPIDNTFTCAAHAQKTVLSCNPTTHVWTALPPCAGQQLCDTTPGPNQGSCQDPAPGCAGRVSGAKFCNGTQSVTCGVDLVTSTSEACPKVCIGRGQCVDCTPLSTRCSNNGVQTCQADGTWGTAAPCTNQACIGGACTGVCTPNTASTHCLNNTPQYCDASGAWQNGAVACTSQACIDGACTGECTPGAGQCSGSQPRICDAKGAWQNNGVACAGATPLCIAGACQNAGPSCSGLSATCGPTGDANCCAANLVTGGTYNRGNDPTHPATVSDFRLDNYEITVGRFRKFVAVYSPTMIPAGAGKNPNNPSDPGWDVAWNANLPASAAVLTSAVSCGTAYQTWTDTPGKNESRPKNCIDWYQAYAFCIWDGGRLPTEAEWNYAAAAGSEQRPYPWGAAAPDCSYANYRNGDYCVSPGTGSANNVGFESPKGDSKWGQSDLAGNLWEWTEDWYGSSTDPCNNCFNTAPAPNRVLRGGSFFDGSSLLLSSSRTGITPWTLDDSVGARCARAR